MRRFPAVFILSFCVLFACRGPNQSQTRNSEASATPVDGDWAIVQSQGEPDGLNPLTSTNSFAHTIQYGVNSSFIFETLLQYNPEDHWRLNKPLLAEAYPEISADHLTYTFKIRDGVKWHDGTPFTADDVVFSAKVTLCPGVDDAAERSQREHVGHSRR